VCGRGKEILATRLSTCAGLSQIKVAARARTDNWSLAKQAELEDFLVATELTRENVDELERAIEAAENEKPIQ